MNEKEMNKDVSDKNGKYVHYPPSIIRRYCDNCKTITRKEFRSLEGGWESHKCMRCGDHQVFRTQ